MKFNLDTYIYNLEQNIWNTQGLRYIELSALHVGTSNANPIGNGHKENKTVVINRGKSGGKRNDT